MKKLMNLFKKGNLIDKIFIVLTPLIIILGIYEISTYEPSNSALETSITSSVEKDKAKEEAEAKAKEEAEAKAKEEAEAKAKEEAEAKAKEEAEAKAKEEAEAKAKEEAEAKAKEEAEAKAKEEAEKENITPTPTINRENIIGTSNKDFKKISTSKPTKVINDTTGNWKLSRISTTDDILEYAKSYYENNFTNDNEIHAIVNFSLNTTTCISKLFDNIISVTVHEYVDKEELDAKKLFSGMVLGDYWIYLDNGDIEKIY